MEAPTRSTVAEVLGWRPRHGVLSIYVGADPADRSERWRIELRNGLDAAVEAARDAGDHDTRVAVEATAHRISGGFLSEPLESEGPGLIGFVEVAPKSGTERWYASGLTPRRTEVLYSGGAMVAPLVELLDRGASLGVAAISSERVRLLDWHLGRISDLQMWELEIFSLDWRERKAPRSRDPAAGQGVSSAGRDQFDQRLEANRERFAEQTGQHTAAEAGKRGWRQLLVFGDERYVRHFAAGLGDRCPLRHVESSDLISEPAHLIERRVHGLIGPISEDRNLRLIEAIKEERAAYGYQEAVQALTEGRVEHLLYDHERDYERDIGERRADGAEPPLIERMIELAIETGAKVTPLGGDAARALDEQGGVAAVLRY